MADDSFIPVYLPDRTVVGKGKVDGQTITIELDKDSVISDLFKESMLGMSFVHMGATVDVNTLDCIEETCTYHMPHNHGLACYAGCSVCN